MQKDSLLVEIRNIHIIARHTRSLPIHQIPQSVSQSVSHTLPYTVCDGHYTLHTLKSEGGKNKDKKRSSQQQSTLDDAQKFT
jgi:hypothetical protein